jgi:hypothetical protein
MGSQQRWAHEYRWAVTAVRSCEQCDCRHNVSVTTMELVMGSVWCRLKCYVLELMVVTGPLPSNDRRDIRADTQGK